MSEKLLTVFTPSYNRAHTLPLGYAALRRQSSKNFEWLIVDDGSTDHTADLVRSWQEECRDFRITYIYKPNGGLHTAYNAAIENIRTELCVCIDSDDYMPDDAVEQIERFARENDLSGVAGFIGRDYDLCGNPLGGEFPRVRQLHLMELVDKYKFRADSKIVLRSELLRQVAPQPVWHGEKNFNPIYMLMQLDRDWSFLLMDRNLCYVEYLEGGMTRSILQQYLNSPRSFAELRLLFINSPWITPRYKWRNYVHLGSSMLLCGEYRELLPRVPSRALLAVLSPLSLLLTWYIIWKGR